MHELFRAVWKLSLFMVNMHYPFRYMPNVGAVNACIQTCGAAILSKSQVAHTHVFSASLLMCLWNGNAQFAFLLERRQGSNNRAPSITLQLLWTSLCKNHCPFAASFCFFRYPWFLLQGLPSCSQWNIRMTTSRGQKGFASAFTLKQHSERCILLV